MGDPRKSRKKYKTPSHPWQKARLDEERIIVKEYGLKNKKELWKMESKLRKYKQRAKRYIADIANKDVEEKSLMLKKLRELGILQENGQLDDVLGLEVRSILERRLQTLVFKKKLAASIRQARQFICHRHIEVNGTKIVSPSYIVAKDEESTISFNNSSPLKSEEHPERRAVMLAETKEAKKLKEKKASEKSKSHKRKKADKK